MNIYIYFRYSEKLGVGLMINLIWILKALYFQLNF